MIEKKIFNYRKRILIIFFGIAPFSLIIQMWQMRSWIERISWNAVVVLLMRAARYATSSYRVHKIAFEESSCEHSSTSREKTWLVGSDANTGSTTWYWVFFALTLEHWITLLLMLHNRTQLLLNLLILFRAESSPNRKHLRNCIILTTLLNTSSIPMILLKNYCISNIRFIEFLFHAFLFIRAKCASTWFVQHRAGRVSASNAELVIEGPFICHLRHWSSILIVGRIITVHIWILMSIIFCFIFYYHFFENLSSFLILLLRCNLI